jgi:hypothetical protein
VILAAVVLFSATSLPAQQVPTGLTARQQQHAAELRFRTAPVDSADSAPTVPIAFGSPDTYRWEGALIGFVTGAVLFTFSGLFWCADAGSACGTEDTIRGIMIGGTLFGFPGMLIGGVFPKHPPARDLQGGPAE